MADAVSPVQCQLFVRTGVAGPQLSSTVRQHHRISSVSDLNEHFDYYLTRLRSGDPDAVFSLLELGTSVLSRAYALDGAAPEIATRRRPRAK